MQITLRAARMNASMTQKEAAQHLGVTVDTVALQIRRIEEAYRVKYDDLIFLPKKTL